MSSNTMKAWTHSRMGLASEVLSLITVPIPAITSPTQVKAKISHCALNPGGSIMMQLLPFVFRASPAIPEMDFSGTIVELGSAVPADQNLVINTQVFGSIPVSQHVRSTSGSLAEYVVVDYTAVLRKPEEAKLEEVAGLGVAGATALELMKAAKLNRGDNVLVNGVSGGIGHLVMQMCRAEVGETGKVVAVCSTNNVGWVKELGADEVIDYKKYEPVHAYLTNTFGSSRFNAVIDAYGSQEIFKSCPQFLADGKPYVTVGPHQLSNTVLGMLYTIGLMAKNFFWPRVLGGVPRPYLQVTGIANIDAMGKLADMVKDGKLRVHVGASVKMSDAKEAYSRLEHAQGKIVVEVDQ